jgi:hypothetical protein
MRALVHLLLLTLALVACGPKRAPPDAAGDAEAAALGADALLARAVEAIGGADALRAHTAMRLDGEVNLAAQGIRGTITLLHAASGDQYTRVEIPGIGLMEEGVTGGVAWASDPVAGPRIKTGIERAQALRQADFYFLLALAEHFPTRERVGPAEIDGLAAWELRMVPAEGPEERWFLDRDSGLLLATRSEIHTLMGVIPVTTRFLEYAFTGGVRSATVLRITNTLMEQEMRVSVTWEPDGFALPPMPEAVSALLPK